jgi:hypothetical protein
MTELQGALGQTIVGLIDEHLAGSTDKAGFSKLDVWIAAEDLEGNLDRADLAEILRTYITSSDMTKSGQWEVVAYLVQKLSLTSEALAAQIEAKLDVSGVIPWEPYDEFSGWLALHHSGGVFAPKHLQKSVLSLRQMQPVKWLSLSLIAHHGNPDGLTDAIVKMVTEGLLKPTDIETRYRALNHALAGSSLAKFLQAIIDAAPTQYFATDLREWAQARLSILLNPPTLQSTNVANDSIDQHIFLVIQNLPIAAPAFQIAA